jgi:hypothetical protein
MLIQINLKNADAEVIVADGEVLPLSELLPMRWSEVE